MDLGDGTLVELTALVDTGSEANLIRRDLVDSRYTESCGTKVGFWAVNNQSLGGNHRKLTCKLLIEGVEVDTKETVEDQISEQEELLKFYKGKETVCAKAAKQTAEAKLKELIQKYSEFINFPIYLLQVRGLAGRRRWGRGLVMIAAQVADAARAPANR